MMKKNRVKSILLMSAAVVGLTISATSAYGKIPQKTFDRNQFQTKTVRLNKVLNRRFVGNNTLKLRNLLNMGRDFQGATLKKIIVVGTSDRARGSATLVINGYQTAKGTLSRHGNQLVLQPNFNENVIGNEVRTVELELNGRINVQKVIAVLEQKVITQRPPRHDDQFDRDITRQINQQLRGNSKMKLSSMMRVRTTPFSSVRTVTLNVDSRSRAQIRLCTLGYGQRCTQPKTVRGFATVRFRLNSDSQLNEIMVETQGTLNIHSATVKF